MSSGSQWLSRPSSPGPSGPLRATDAGARQEPARGFSDLDEVNTCCQEALDGALELVRADGGEVAILDSEGAALVTRARRKRPPRLPGFGSPSRPSQPINQVMTTEPLAPLDSQVTQLLPSAQMSRAYAPDQGLIGEVWKRREPMNVRLDEHTAAADATMLVEADARNHLAVPIFRPDELSHLGGRGAVIGVLRVFNRDPLWPYSNNDRMLLELHADRLGRTLAMLEPSVINVRRSDLVTALRALASVGASRRGLLERAGEIALHQINAFSFTALAYNSRNERASVDVATRAAATDGEMAVTDLPPWLQRAIRGDFVRESAPQGGSPGALAWLGWSQATPIRSALAAPLRAGGHTFEVIVATSPQIDAFTDDAAVLFEALSLGLATFVDNAIQVEKARRSVEQVSALNNSVQALNSTLDLKATLQQLAEQASLVSSKRACAVFLRAEGADELVCQAVYPHEIEQRGALLDATIPLAWQGIDERLKNSTYVLVDELTGGGPDSATAKLMRMGVSGCCATPIVREGVDEERERDLGALITFNTGPMTGYLPEEHILLNGLASQAASAIGNARVYAQLQQAYAQLQELDRLKDDFILTVSHEFRTPLTAIEGYVTLITKHGHKLDQSKLQQFATEIHQATVQLAGMISMLADANRMSTQPLRITPHPVNLAAVASDAIGAQPPDAKERITLRIADHIWVGGDDERLPLVFTNLVSNAIKYSGAGKNCRVSARLATRTDLVAAGRKLQIGGGDTQEWVVVTVEDDGPGISAEDQAKLFQKFVRLAQSLVTPVRGTGLGLWICRQYVDALGGDIWVESRLGQGSRFNFCLPRVPAPAN